MLENDIFTDPSPVFSPQPERYMAAADMFLSSIHSFDALSEVPIHATSFMSNGEYVGEAAVGTEQVFGTGDGEEIGFGEGDVFGVGLEIGVIFGVWDGDGFADIFGVGDGVILGVVFGVVCTCAEPDEPDEGVGGAEALLLVMGTETI